MTENIILIYYFIIVCVGMFCSGSLFTLQSSNKNEMIKLFFWCYSFFSLFNICTAVKSYITLQSTYNNLLSGTITALQLAGIIFTLYILAFMTHKIFSVPYAKKVNLPLLFLSVIVWGFSTLGILYENRVIDSLPEILHTDYSHEIYDVMMLVYIITVCLLYKKNIKGKKLDRILMRTICITLVFVPAFIIDELNYDEGSGMIFVSLFYLVMSVLSIYYFQKYSDSVQSEKYTISEAFKQKYSISPREADVMLLLLKGHSYNKISEELVVSLSTVRTHASNIYRKTGVSSRYELYHLLS